MELASTDVVDQAARTRRSIRDFRPDPVDLGEVTRILELGSLAPSAWNLQPWRFVVVTDPAMQQTLQAAAFGQRQVGQAPVVIVIYSDMVETLSRIDEVMHPGMPDEAKTMVKGNIERTFASMPEEARDHWGNAQANILLGYLLLLFAVHDYGTSPMLGFDPPAVRAALNLPEHSRIPAILAVGHPAMPPAGPPHRLPCEDLVRYVRPAS